MRGDQQVIDYLNRALRHELAAVNQYWLHYRILDNWGYKEFAKTWRKESIEEMQRADRLVARILFLDGQHNMQSLDQLRIGKTSRKSLNATLRQKSTLASFTWRRPATVSRPTIGCRESCLRN